MIYYYISYWHSRDGERYRLTGIWIASLLGDLVYYNPEDKEPSFGICLGDGPRFLSVPDIIKLLSNHGDGYTYQFDAIRWVMATNIEAAARKAWQKTVKKYGSEEIDLWQSVDGMTLIDLGSFED